MKKFRFILIAFFSIFLVACDFGGTSQNEKEACIIFNTMGGKLLSVMSDLEVGEVVTLPIPTKTNANFLGWYTTRDYTDTVLPSEYTYEKPITLYAKWEVSGYTLTFNYGEGQEVVYNLEAGEDLSQYIPLPDKNYHTYMFSPVVPEVMPAEDLIINATLYNLEEDYLIENDSIIEYFGDDLNVTVPTNYFLDGEIINITTIQSFAYYENENLMNLIVPTGIQTIYDFAIYGCEELRRITIHDGLETIMEYGICDNERLEKIDLPKSLRNIEGSSFNSCTRLENIIVHEENEYFCTVDGNLYSKDGTVLKIYAPGKKATSFTIPEGVKVIGEYAFYEIEQLTHLYISEGVETLEKRSLSSCVNLVEVSLPSTLKTIGDGAFYFCPLLSNVILPEGLETIETDAFGICDSIVTIDIPASVKYIGVNPFMGIEKLESINVHEDNRYYKSIDGNLYTKDGEVLIIYCPAKTDEEFIVPEGVKVLEDYAIHSATSLTSIILPDSLTTLGSRSIFRLPGLVEITIPSNVSFIGEATLQCVNLVNIFVEEDNQHFKSIDGNLYSKDGTVLIWYCIGKDETRFVIPDTVTTIGYNNFSGCDLREVVIPASVTTIEKSVFLLSWYLTIYCEVESKPDSWPENWHGYCDHVWGYKESE